MSIVDDFAEIMGHARAINPAMRQDALEDAEADRQWEPHKEAFKSFFSNATDWEAMFSPEDFNKGIDVAMIGQRLLDEYRASYEEFTGEEWRDA